MLSIDIVRIEDEKLNALGDIYRRLCGERSCMMRAGSGWAYTFQDFLSDVLFYSGELRICATKQR